MRSYGQFCGVARALDVVGDRWSLLVVRELLVRPCRFTAVRNGLPGVARNLLVERLRALEDAGLVRRDDGLYALTERGRALEPVLRELVRWSIPLMVTGQGDDAACGHWAGLAAETLFDGADLRDLADFQVGVEADGEVLTLQVEPDAGLRAALGSAPAPDVVLRGSVEAVLGALTGLPTTHVATVEGDEARLAELRGRVVLG